MVRAVFPAVSDACTACHRAFAREAPVDQTMTRSPNAQLAWLSLAMFLGMTLWFSATAANAAMSRNSTSSPGRPPG